MKKQQQKAKKSPQTNAAKSIKREPVTLPIGKLHLAPWNPRGEITEESVADLIPTIKSKGLIQRIAVVWDWASDGGKEDLEYIVVAGNRRLVACRAAGLKEVPCELFTCTEAVARQLTLIENLKRKDAEPLYVAKTIQTLRDEDKMTMEEIAAEIGMPESWVYRRAKLIDLAPEWKDAVSNGTINVTTDLLEKASRYTQEVQKEAYDEIVRSYDTSARLSWADVSREFENRVANLEKATFDRKKCAMCPNNSACSPSLWDFGETPTDKKYGICLDSRCFNLKKQEAENAAIAKLESKGVTVVKVKDFFSVPEDSLSLPNAIYKFACVYHDYNGNLAVRYASKDPTANEDEKKAVNTTDKERAKALKEAIKKIKEWETEHLLEWLTNATDCVDDAAFAGKFFALAYAYGVANGSFNYELRDLAKDIVHGGKVLRSQLTKRLADAIEGLDDASASLTLSIFEAANDSVTPEERQLVLRGK